MGFFGGFGGFGVVASLGFGFRVCLGGVEVRGVRVCRAESSGLIRAQGFGGLSRLRVWGYSPP